MNGNDEERTGPSRALLGLVGIGLLAVLIIWWPGCRKYAPVHNAETLELMKLLYTACNTQDKVRLQRVETTLATLVREGKMTPTEQAAFDRIISTAKSGNWQKAADEAFRMAQDQVRGG